MCGIVVAQKNDADELYERVRLLSTETKDFLIVEMLKVLKDDFSSSETPDDLLGAPVIGREIDSCCLLHNDLIPERCIFLGSLALKWREGICVSEFISKHRSLIEHGRVTPFAWYSENPIALAGESVSYKFGKTKAERLISSIHLDVMKEMIRYSRDDTVGLPKLEACVFLESILNDFPKDVPTTRDIRPNVQSESK